MVWGRGWRLSRDFTVLPESAALGLECCDQRLDIRGLTKRLQVGRDRGLQCDRPTKLL
eukprot:JP437975.1.p3 GENE.JP437975.1~~JP437975.1.p3  ORF type:complete len:58 (-),score=0.19 JP437975.1:215-388(-)